MHTITSTATLKLHEPPSCIAFVPHAPQLAVIGTYYLHEHAVAAGKSEDGTQFGGGEEPGPQSKIGSLVLVEIRDGSIEVLATLACSFAIFDLHFVPQDLSEVGPGLLAVATSVGSLTYFLIDTFDTPIPRIISQGYRSLRTKTTESITYFSWHPTQRGTLVLTTSTGRVSLARVESPPLGSVPKTEVMLVTEHSEEAWVAVFAPDGSRVYSGGDDAALCYADISHVLPKDADNTEHLSNKMTMAIALSEPLNVVRDTRIHGAGVTAILPLSPDIILTGSYDDHLRLLSLHWSGRRTVLAEAHLGGGVWRLDPLQRRENGTTFKVRILASCMHAGAKIVDVERLADGMWKIEVQAEFLEHKSMNYGAVLQPTEGQDQNDLVGRQILSISFYDMLVCRWSIPEEMASSF